MNIEITVHMNMNSNNYINTVLDDGGLTVDTSVENSMELIQSNMPNE